MKKTFLSILATTLFLSFNAGAENYKFDPHHTSVVWSAEHFGFSSVSGKFSEIEGNLVLNEKNPAKSEMKVIIKTNNLFTGYDKFDNHLKSEDLFDVKKFPEATFVSKKVILTGKKTAKVVGDLTIKGVTKSVTLNVKLNKIDFSPITQVKTAGFTALASIKRSEFGIDYAVPQVSDVVKLTIEAEAGVENASAAK